MTDESSRVGSVAAARILSVGISTVQRWIDDGHLPAHKTPGGHRRIMTRDLLAFAESRGIPLSTALESDTAQKTSHEEGSHILIVDDDRDLLETLSMRIAGLRPDLTIHTAYNGFSAGVLLQKHRPVHVLLDIRMPGLSGVDVCRMIKRDPALAHTRVIGMTAYREEPDVMAMIDAGVEDMLFKPFDFEKLADLLSRVAPTATPPTHPAAGERGL